MGAKEAQTQKIFNTFLASLMGATRGASDYTVVLRHSSHLITSFDELRMHTAYVRAHALRAVGLIDELTRQIEAGELSVDALPVTPGNGAHY